MNPQDRQAIDGLFTKLDDVARTAGPRDAEAEAFIAQRMNERPGSAYYLAQTVVMQQQALENAQQRIAALEQRAGTRSGGAGASAAWGNRAGLAPQQQAPAAAPPATGFGRSAGGGFLAGAAQTAVGVAGGMMLGSLLGGLFGGNEAQAAENPDAAHGGDAGQGDEASAGDDLDAWQDGDFPMDDF